MNRLLSITVFLSASLTASLTAQVNAAGIRGLLERAPAASVCQDRATHVFHCAQLRLRSQAVDLSLHEGQIVEVEGLFVSISPGCRVFEVRAISRPVETLATSAVGYHIGLGQPLGFVMHGVAHDAWIQLIAGGNALIATPFGTLLLEPRTLLVANSGAFDATGFAASHLTVPNDPSLVGADFHWQNLTASAIRRDIALSNSDCVTVVR